jgi:hypothetical protein
VVWIRSLTRVIRTSLSSSFESHFEVLTIVSFRMMVDDDIEAIIEKGEERALELNSKYEQLNLEDLRIFKSDASVQQWKGEDFRSGVGLLFSPRINHLLTTSFSSNANPSTSTSSPSPSANLNPTTPSTRTSRTPSGRYEQEG